MAYEIELAERVADEIRKMPKELAARILKKVKDLEVIPYHLSEKLKGDESWRLRVGDYRIIFDIDEKEKKIYITDVGHRKNIYKK